MPMNPARRKIVVGGALLALGPLIARAQAPIATALIVPGAPVTEQALPGFAAEAGILESLGVRAQFLRPAGPSSALDALDSGAHLAYSSPTQVAERFLKGGDVVLVATVIEPNRGGMLMGGPAVRGPANLRGARVAVLSAEGASAAAVQAVFDRMGAGAPNLEPVASYEAAYAALAGGRVDAAWLPVDLALKGRVAHNWTAFEGVRLTLPGGYVTTRRAIAAQRGLIETLMQSLVAAIHFFKADAAATARVLQKVLGVDAAVAAELQAFYAPILRPAPAPSIYYGLNGLRQALRARYPAAERMQATDLVEPSFIDAMVRDGTIAKLYGRR
jgi:hypothetical protein